MSFGVSQATGKQGLPNLYLSIDDSTGTIDQRAVWIDDFVGTTVSTAWTKSGSGTAVHASGGVGFCSLLMSTGAVLNQDVTLTWAVDNVVMKGSKRSIWESAWHVNATTNNLVRMGLYDTATSYIYLELDNATRGNSNYWLVRNDGTGEAADDTGIPAQTSSTAQNMFKIYSNSATTVKLYAKYSNANIVSAWTYIGEYSTKLPTTLSPYLYIKSLDGSNMTSTVDYVKVSAFRQNV